MVRGIIDLSGALGFTCIAEGVERENQRSVLDELGCDNAQGFLFARPASGPDIAQAPDRPNRSSSVPHDLELIVGGGPPLAMLSQRTWR
jgi:EAL domain-containing protein (putative c-di-GMP-specific phosphodiesterase class I)